ncbi:MAG: DJ-1/PfpI family protein [Chloroflexi bacterium]|nr:MAG: DJ-1/PfpI family protein [Chloroflexota bacterium]TME39272.1 MAG: DJ-1/PfpI family protein [Chloroflexota bacterium]
MKIDIAVFDGMDELDAVAPLEVLRSAAERGAPFDVQLVTIGLESSVRCAHGLVMVPDGVVRPDADLLIFPGGGWVARSAKGARHEADSGRWVPVIEEAEARGSILASVCTGAMILASAGALTNRRATTHHGAWRDLEAAGATLVHERVVDDGDRITAGGVTSGIDLGLWLVERFAGQEMAAQIAENLEYRAAHHAC